MSIVFAVSAILLLILVASGIHRVKPGTRLVIYRFGKVAGIGDPGFRFLVPMVEKGVPIDLGVAVPEYFEGFPPELLEKRLQEYLARGTASAAPEPPPAADPQLKTFVTWLLDRASEQTGVDLRQDAMAIRRIEEAALKVQDALGTEERFRISLPFLTADASGPKNFELEVSRADLRSLPK